MARENRAAKTIAPTQDSQKMRHHQNRTTITGKQPEQDRDIQVRTARTE